MNHICFTCLEEMTVDLKSPYPLRLWYKPHTTMQGLIAERKGHTAAVVVAALFGIAQSGRVCVGMEQASPMAIVAGPLAGVAVLYLTGMLARNFSRWFGGGGELKAARTALGLSMLPWTLLSLVLFVALIRLEDISAAKSLIYFLFIGFIYGYVILLQAMSAALGLTVLRTFACLVLTFLVAVALLSFVAQILLGLFA